MASASIAKVQAAVNDPEWQEVRQSLKGIPTKEKIEHLAAYYKLYGGDRREKIQIQVDNYIKSLCRGGQLRKGTTLKTALDNNWDLTDYTQR